MSSGKVSDEELVQAIEEFYRVVCTLYNPALDDADDLKQEIALALLKARNRYNPEVASWRDYAFTIARAAAKTYYRNHPRIGVKWNRADGEAHITTNFDGLVYEPHVKPNTDYLEFEQCLQHLSEKEKRICVLKLCGFTSGEISNMLSISVPVIHQSLYALRIKSSRYFSSLLTASPPRPQE